MARWVVCVAASSDKRSHSSTKAMTALDERQCGRHPRESLWIAATVTQIYSFLTSQGLSLSEGQEIGSQLRSVKESIPDVVTTPTLKASRKNPPGASWMKNCCQFSGLKYLEIPRLNFLRPITSNKSFCTKKTVRMSFQRFHPSQATSKTCSSIGQVDESSSPIFPKNLGALHVPLQTKRTWKKRMPMFQWTSHFAVSVLFQDTSFAGSTCWSNQIPSIASISVPWCQTPAAVFPVEDHPNPNHYPNLQYALMNIPQLKESDKWFWSALTVGTSAGRGLFPFWHTSIPTHHYPPLKPHARWVWDLHASELMLDCLLNHGIHVMSI